jgi:hypothetical protein
MAVKRESRPLKIRLLFRRYAGRARAFRESGNPVTFQVPRGCGKFENQRWFRNCRDQFKGDYLSAYQQT